MGCIVNRFNQFMDISRFKHINTLSNKGEIATEKECIQSAATSLAIIVFGISKHISRNVEALI